MQHKNVFKHFYGILVSDNLEEIIAQRAEFVQTAGLRFPRRLDSVTRGGTALSQIMTIAF